MFSLPYKFDNLSKRLSLTISHISAPSKLPMITLNEELFFSTHISSLVRNNDLGGSNIASSVFCSIVANDLAYSIDLSKRYSVIDG